MIGVRRKVRRIRDDRHRSEREDRMGTFDHFIAGTPRACEKTQGTGVALTRRAQGIDSCFGASNEIGVSPIGRIDSSVALFELAMNEARLDPPARREQPRLLTRCDGEPVRGQLSW